MPAEKLKEWKDQWNHGDVKFVPDLFELTMDLLFENERLKDQFSKDKELEHHLYRQLEEQNKLLMDQLMKVHDTRTTTEIFIPAANITEEVWEWVQRRRETQNDKQTKSQEGFTED